MDLGVNYIFNASTEIERAASYVNSVRLLQLPLQAFSSLANATPIDEFLAVIPWVPASSTSIPNFSAECWLTAAGLYDAQYATGRRIPIGAIQSDWPGNSITQLSSPSAMAVPCAGDADFAGAAAIDPRAPTFPGPIPGPGHPSSQYNAMVAPLAVGPLAVGAFIYHQGEADVHGWYGPSGPVTYETIRAWYACRLRALIADFRATFAASPPALPWFGVSMLAPYAGDCGTACAFVPAVRAAQMDVSLSEPNVTCAVLVDGGDPTAPAGSVHSRNKQVVAKVRWCLPRAILLPCAHVSPPPPRPALARSLARSASSPAPWRRSSGSPRPPRRSTARRTPLQPTQEAPPPLAPSPPTSPSPLPRRSPAASGSSSGSTARRGAP